MNAVTARVHPAAPSLIEAIVAASPRLWELACSRSKVKGEQRHDLRRSVAWLIEKRGFEVATAASAEYYNSEGTVLGKVDLLATCEKRQVLAIEIDFRPSSASAYKLLSLKRDGIGVLLLTGYGVSYHGVRQQVDGWFKKPTHFWLPIGMLVATAR